MVPTRKLRVVDSSISFFFEVIQEVQFLSFIHSFIHQVVCFQLKQN